LAALAMTAFAANSILCRLALRSGSIDPASFTSIRLASGAAMLVLASGVTRSWTRPHWENRGQNAAMLFIYAVAFSFAYGRLSAGMGALVLFGSVQVTMVFIALLSGERLSTGSWAGFALAFSGLVVLTLPGLSAPPLLGSLLMATAGAAWGVYSILGRRSISALLSTAHSFQFAAPMAVAINLLTWRDAHLSGAGVALAVASGAVTSGLGYVVWYIALRGLSATSAALTQLTVPVIAALAGVLVLSESIGWRLVVSGTMILGGVALALAFRRKR
jgi:drug/metabolite transporter (DMT)-like permease